MQARRPPIAPFLATILLMLHILTGHARGQGIATDVASRIAMVSRDSVMRFVAELSGEDSIFVSGTARVVKRIGESGFDTTWVSNAFVRLPNRVEWANDAATDYLVRRLRQFGYDSVWVDSYPDNEEYPTTKNVIAYKPATQPNAPVWLLGAHYDSVVQAPGADDNASGTAVVLECARILSDADLNANLIFALWDTEEAGLIGSELFAAKAESQDWRIDGVLNFDMVGWDRDGDHSVELHAQQPSRWIADYMGRILSDYALDLSPNFVTPGIGRSDHVSFRDHGFPAVLVIEELNDGFNPYYHSPDDVIGILRPDFLLEVAKMAVGTAAQLGFSGTLVSTDPEPALPRAPELQSVYPNPASHFVYFAFSRHERTATLLVTDVLGRLVGELRSGQGTTLRWTIPSDLANGVYTATYVADGFRQSRLFIVQR